jgi:acyl-CoA synthetase (NDP forming)
MQSSTKHALFPFVEPESVAIVGASASPGKAGYELLRNLLANEYRGKIYPVNPKASEILGLRVYPTVADLPGGIDVGLVILPAEGTVAAVRGLAAKGIRNQVLLAGGFAELDEAGARIQQELIDIIRETGIRVLGPNTSGHISTPHCFTSAFFPLGKIRRGSVSVVAQTGNFATHTMKHILTHEYFGVCRVLGIGNKIDIDESDALEFLAGDPETTAIVMYLESFKRPRHFLEIARAVTRVKPVVLLKGATSAAGKQAAVAHTAAMASQDRLVDAMLRQAGIVRVWKYSHLILAVKALSMVCLPKGNRVSFLAPSGAMLVALTDFCMGQGLVVPAVSPQTVARLQEISPAYLPMRNPVDIWGAASTKGVEFAYREGMEAVLKDANIDAVVPVLMLARETGVPPSYEFIPELVRRYPDKPVLVSFSAAKECEEECKALLEARGVPTFPEIEQPFEALSILVQCRQAMNRLQASAVG